MKNLWQVLFLSLLMTGLSRISSVVAQDFMSINDSISLMPKVEDRIIAYRDFIDHNKSTNPEICLALGADAIATAKRAEDIKSLGKLYYTLSLSQYYLFELDSMIVYAQLGDSIALILKDLKLSSTCNNLLGIAYKGKAEYTTALECFISSIKYAEAGGDSVLAGTALINMAQIYDVMHDTTTTVETYKKSIGVFSRFNDSLNLGVAYQNLGIYINNKDSAIYYQEKALVIFEKINNVIGQGYSLNGLGARYIDQGDYFKGLSYLERAEKVWQSQNFREGLPSVYLNLASAYAKKGLFIRAEQYWTMAETLGKELNDIDFLTEYYESKSHELKKSGFFEESLLNYELFIQFKDSLTIIERQEDLAEIEAKYKSERRLSEIELLNKDIRIRDLSLQKSHTRTLLLSLSSLLLLGFSAVSYFFFRRAERAKEKSDELLLNILPAQIAEELKTYGKTTAKSYDSIAVLFTDFEGFSSIAQQLTASDIIDSIDYYFKKFDAITVKYNIEKIKTIGDAYLAVSGLSNDPDYVRSIVNAAIEMQEVVAQIHKDQNHCVKHPFNMRIGIHVGPLVAGVVGIRKFQYDIWGNTVNIASRLESTGEAGHIAISEDVFQTIKSIPDFEFIRRELFEIKNIGLIQSYFVHRKA